MKKKNKTNNWHIDDVVFFLEETDHNGEFPVVRKGTVEEIRRDCLRILLKGEGWENLVWVDADYVFTTGGNLMRALEKHIEDQVAELNGCVY